MHQLFMFLINAVKILAISHQFLKIQKMPGNFCQLFLWKSHAHNSEWEYPKCRWSDFLLAGSVSHVLCH